MLDSPSWIWGLALIVLTTAIHSLGIVLLSLLGLRIRAYLKRQSFHLWQAVTVLTMLIGTIGLSLALLHGIEAALWAEAYLLLGALDTPADDALFNRFDDHARRFGVNTAPALAGDGRIGRRCRRVDVRCQYRVHVFRYATLLTRDTRDPTALKRLWEPPARPVALSMRRL